MSASSRLKELIEKLDVSDVVFAKTIGMSKPNLSSYKNGGRNIGAKTARTIEKLYNVNPDWLLEGKGSMFLTDVVEPVNLAPVPFDSITNFPIYAYVYCGTPASQWDINQVREYYQLPKLKKYKNVFGLIAKGDSMVPYINPHDLIICADMPEKIKNGTAVVAVFNGVDTIDANAKLIKFKENDKKITLYSINTKYAPEDYGSKDILKLYKVVRIIREVE